MSADAATGQEPADRVSGVHDGGDPAAAQHTSGDHRRSRLRVFVEADLVVLVMAGVAFAGGWLWHHWWAPAPPGIVGIPATGDDRTQQWFPVPGEAGERAMFAATAEYVIVAAAIGLLLGLLAVLLARRSAFVTLLAVVVGSAVAAFVMYRFGTSLAPPDPDPIALTLKPGDSLPGSLSIKGLTPFVAWPVGALVGYFLGGMVLHLRGQARVKRDDPGWLQPGRDGTTPPSAPVPAPAPGTSASVPPPPPAPATSTTEPPPPR